MKKAVFLLHGYATDKNDFFPIIPFLEEKYDYVLNCNLPGHGEKGLKNFTVEDTFKFIDENYEYLINNYDIVDVIGYSMGGALATYVVGKGGINKAILLAPANTYLNIRLPFSKIKSALELILDKEDKEAIAKRKKNIKRDNKYSLEMALKVLLPNYTIHSIRTFMKVIKRCNENLSRNNTPTLLLWGEIDQLVPKKTISLIKSYFHNTHLVIFPEISHLMLKSADYGKVMDEMICFINDDSISEHNVEDNTLSPFDKVPKIKQDRLRIKGLKKSYLDDLEEIFERKEIFIRYKIWQKNYKNNQGIYWTIELEKGNYIGIIGVIEDDNYGNVELYLKKEYEQRYIYDDILQIIEKNFFNIMDIDKIRIRTDNELLRTMLGEFGYEQENNCFIKEEGLDVGRKIRTWVLPDSNGIIRDSNYYLGHKLVVFFYSKDFITSSVSDALAFKELFEEYKKKNILIIGISKDSISNHRKFKEKFEIPYILLSDEKLDVSKHFGVYKEWGLYEQKVSKISKRVFYINERGILEQVFEGVKPQAVLDYIVENE